MTTDEKSVFNFFDPEFQKNPQKEFTRLVKECPFSKSTIGPEYYAVARYNDIIDKCRDAAHWSSKFGPTLQFFSPEDKRALVNVDPPEHDIEVQIVRRAFSGQYVKSLESGIRNYCKELVAGIVNKKEVDIQRAYSLPVPLFVICKLLGIDYADAKSHGFDSWVEENALAALYNPDDLEKAKIAEAAQSKMLDYFAPRLKDWSDKIERGVAEPDENLITRLVTAEHEGKKLTTNKILGFCGFLLVAGSATTSTAISNLIFRLAEYPDQRRKLLEDMSLIDGAVEEGLRFDAPVHGLFRTNNEPTDLGGFNLKKDSKVALLWGAGNLDPSFVENPMEFNIERDVKTNRRNLSFGYGIHTCLGSSLARMEIRIAIEELLAQIPDYQISGKSERTQADVMSGFDSLKINW